MALAVLYTQLPEPDIETILAYSTPPWWHHRAIS